jgi:hypothetical protein
MSVDELALELLSLPAKSRAALAHRLIESLEDDDAPDVRDQWVEVAQRRSRELREGKVEGIPAEDVFSELERELG